MYVMHGMYGMYGVYGVYGMYGMYGKNGKYSSKQVRYAKRELYLWYGIICMYVCMCGM